MSQCLSVSRVWLRFVTKLSVMALLSAQISVAAYVCPRPGAETDLAAGIMTASSADSDIEQAGKHSSLCHHHCDGNVALGHIEPPGLPPALFTALVVPLFEQHRALLAPRLAAVGGYRLAAVPLRLLFCVLRN